MAVRAAPYNFLLLRVVREWGLVKLFVSDVVGHGKIVMRLMVKRCVKGDAPYNFLLEHGQTAAGACMAVRAAPYNFLLRRIVSRFLSYKDTVHELLGTLETHRP